jgi:hypothetical protein
VGSGSLKKNLAFLEHWWALQYIHEISYAVKASAIERAPCNGIDRYFTAYPGKK